MLKFSDETGYTFTVRKDSIMHTILLADERYTEVKEEKDVNRKNDKKYENKAGTKK